MKGWFPRGFGKSTHLASPRRYAPVKGRANIALAMFSHQVSNEYCEL